MIDHGRIDVLSSRSGCLRTSMVNKVRTVQQCVTLRAFEQRTGPEGTSLKRVSNPEDQNSQPFL